MLNNLQDMDKFLQMYNLPRLNKEETENPKKTKTKTKTKKLIASKKTESAIKTFHQTKVQGQTASLPLKSLQLSQENRC